MKVVLILVIIGGLYYAYTEGMLKDFIPVEQNSKVVGIAKNTKGKEVKTKDALDYILAYKTAEDHENKAVIVKLATYAAYSSGEGKLLRTFRSMVEDEAPDKLYFDFHDNDFPNQCRRCKGTGAVICEKCRGTGKCVIGSRCKGGKITYQGINSEIKKTCPSCKGAAQCLFCKGVGNLTEGEYAKACPHCYASGYAFDIEKVKVKYQKEVRELLK